MQILTLPSMQTIASVPGGGVWVLGFFDGVHAGHQKLLSAAAALAGEKNGPVGVWTFTALPKAKELLTAPDERAAFLSQYGVELLVTEDFDAVAHLSGEVFFREILLAQFAPSAIVCGFNFRFGHGGQSAAADLVRWGREAGVTVSVTEPFLQSGEAVSSTRIRALVRNGEMEAASAMLTRPYSITGTVEHGKALGRKLGFPTANIRLPAGKVPPQRGIYACLVRFADENGVVRERLGVCNIGSRPTVNGNTADVTVETWILDFSGDLYGKQLSISLYKKIRDERRFDSLEALTGQVNKDADTVRNWFASHENEMNNGKLF